MKMKEQLEQDAKAILILELIELDQKGLIKEAPLSTDLCIHRFYCENKTYSEGHMNLFYDVYYKFENEIHEALENNREQKRK